MGTLKMSTKERRRMELLSRVKEGALKLVKAACLGGLSYRQMKRVWKRYRVEGDAGLVHRGRGRRSNRGKDEGFRKKVLARYEEQYPGFGPTLASEYLAQENLVVDHETLRRWLLEAGHWQKQRKRQKHRQRRERRAQRGELVQMDGSYHDWFGGRRPWAVLMVMIDDATNRTYARFYEAEDTRAALDLFGRYARRYGLPHALYVDHDSIYECTREARLDEQLRGEGPQTQFARCMSQLGVEVIAANSPQAKGRVERRHGVFQDRLVKALWLLGIDTVEAANAYLEATFLPELNQRFTVRAREPGDLHRPIPTGLALKEVLCFEEPRVVQNDWIVRWRSVSANWTTRTPADKAALWFFSIGTMVSVKNSFARRISSCPALEDPPDPTILAKAVECIRATSSVSNPSPTAWRPSPGVACRGPTGPFPGRRYRRRAAP